MDDVGNGALVQPILDFDVKLVKQAPWCPGDLKLGTPDVLVLGRCCHFVSQCPQLIRFTARLEVIMCSTFGYMA